MFIPRLWATRKIGALLNAIRLHETTLNEALEIVREAKEKFAAPAQAHLTGRSLRDHLAMYFVRRPVAFKAKK